MMNNLTKRSMSNVPVAVAFVALGLIAFMPANRSAQPEEPKVFRACYVPRSGVVYRIGEPDLRSECQRRHVEFSWNEQGPQGDPGPPGPSNGGGLTRTVFSGTCLKDGAFDDDGGVRDGDIISVPSITFADPPAIVVYEVEDRVLNPGLLENFRDRFFVRDGEIIILCPSDMTDGGFFFRGNDYKIVMIQ